MRSTFRISQSLKSLSSLLPPSTTSTTSTTSTSTARRRHHPRPLTARHTQRPHPTSAHRRGRAPVRHFQIQKALTSKLLHASFGAALPLRFDQSAVHLRSLPSRAMLTQSPLTANLQPDRPREGSKAVACLQSLPLKPTTRLAALAQLPDEAASVRINGKWTPVFSILPIVALFSLIQSNQRCSLFCPYGWADGPSLSTARITSDNLQRHPFRLPTSVALPCVLASFPARAHGTNHIHYQRKGRRGDM
ncbi:hypothetical protein PWT90_10994 [Aphanocladium album]|nr:hypothetical protein PWT90_10994 [Aphanocladium album]